MLPFLASLLHLHPNWAVSLLADVVGTVSQARQSSNPQTLAIDLSGSASFLGGLFITVSIVIYMHNQKHWYYCKEFCGTLHFRHMRDDVNVRTLNVVKDNLRIVSKHVTISFAASPFSRHTELNNPQIRVFSLFKQVVFHKGYKAIFFFCITKDCIYKAIYNIAKIR